MGLRAGQVDILRIWQPKDKTIAVRWTVVEEEGRARAGRERANAAPPPYLAPPRAMRVWI